MDTAWKVLPHGPLVQLADRIWWVEGELPNMSLRRTCTVVRRADGSLLVHSPICLDEPRQAELDALGPVRWIVVPSRYHRMDASRWAARYPEAKVLCPPGVIDPIRAVVRVDGTTDTFPAAEDVRFEEVRGVKDRERVIAVRAGDGLTLIFCDLLFCVPHAGGFHGCVLRLMGSSGGPRVTRLAKLALVSDRVATRTDLQRLADLPGLVRLVPGHGEVIDQDAPGVLRAVATAL